MPPLPPRSRDPYAVLGLAPHADEVVVRAAYKALMRKHHPDVNAAADAAERTGALTEAFRLIGTPERRAAYDRQQAALAVRPPPPRPAAAARPPAPPPKRRRGGCAVAILVLAGLLGVAAALALGVASLTSGPPLPTLFADASDTAAPDPSAGPPAPDLTAIATAGRRAAALVRGGDLAKVHAAHRQCLAQATGSWSAVDDCVAFDLAAAAALHALPDAVSDSAILVAADIVDGRYAGAGLPGDTAARVDLIRQTAIAGVAGQAGSSEHPHRRPRARPHQRGERPDTGIGPIG